MADQIIDVPGVGQVSFPDSMSDDDVIAAVTKLHQDANINKVTAKAEDYYKPTIFQQPVVDSLKQGGMGVLKGLGGIVTGAANTVMHPIKTLEDATAARMDAGKKAETAPTAIERGAYKAASYVPFLGPAVMSAVENIGSGDAERMGTGLTEAAAIATPLGAPKSTAAATTATARGVVRAAKAAPGVVKAVVKNPAVRTGAAMATDLATAGRYSAFKNVKMLEQIARQLEEAKAPPVNRGGTLVGRPTAEVLQKALEELRQPEGFDPELQPTAETPTGQPPVTRGGQTPETLARQMEQGTATPQEALATAEKGNVPLPPKPPKGVDPVAAAMSKSAGLPEPATVQQLAQEELAGMSEREMAERDAMRGTPEDIPNNPVAQETERLRNGASPTPTLEDALAAREGIPAEPPTVHRSKSKRPTYTDNDLKAAKDKWGTSDLADLRGKYGDEAVNAYLLEQRALRHKGHYKTAQDQAAGRRNGN